MDGGREEGGRMEVGRDGGREGGRKRVLTAPLFPTSPLILHNLSFPS